MFKYYQNQQKHKAFQLLGFDVLLDKKGNAQCLEVNGAPSISVEHEIPIEQDPNNKTKKDKEYILSPIDVQLKVNIMNSAIELVTKKKKYSKFKCLTLILGDNFRLDKSTIFQ